MSGVRGVSHDEMNARQVEHVYEADPETGRRLAEGLDLDIESIVDEALLAVEGEIPDADRVVDPLQ